ncbi:MAG: hypothetical protein V7641_2131 [Blastocatellia bacterium]
MLNILAIRCGLSFAPYLAEALTGYLNDGRFNSRVVKQGGNGLILRSDAEMALRFEARQASLGYEEARHYSATIDFRRDFYDIARMADEIIIANIGESLLLSHPQSELWLEAHVIAALLRVYDSGANANLADGRLPDWLNISTGAGRLLLSDQRTGRWVLLGADHVAELERRAGLLAQAGEAVRRAKPPTLIIKGITVHLQTAFKLADSLERFAESGNVMAFTEQAPGYELAVEKATEGMALRDFDQRVALTAREARKYAAILRDELEQRRATQFERGSLRTVIADDGDVRWVLQWGDEVLLTGEALAVLQQAASGVAAGNLMTRRDGEFLLLLEPASGACVALTETEAAALQG